MAHVVIKVKGNEIASLNLNGPTLLGRAAHCRISVQDTLISRNHLRLLPDTKAGPDRWAVVDLESANGTLVDGERIARHTLSDGDLIEAGHITMVFFEDSLAGGGTGDGQNPLIIGERALTAQTTLSGTAAITHLPPPSSISENQTVWKSVAKPEAVVRPKSEPATALTPQLKPEPQGAPHAAVPHAVPRAFPHGVSHGVSHGALPGASSGGLPGLPKAAGNKQEITWDQLAREKSAPRVQPDGLGKRLNNFLAGLPMPVTAAAMALTGLVLFALAFYLTNKITG
jgi:pSer/pThr/pTyr-binding forkhead associated (FHA) protein